MVEPFFSNPSAILTPKTAPSRTLLFALTLCILGLYALRRQSGPEAPPPSLPSGNANNPLYFQDLFLSSASNATVASYLRALTLRPHVAGTADGRRAARYVRAHFEDLGLETRVEEFQALLSYPAHSSLAAHFSNGTSADLPLAEPGSRDGGVVPPYHAYSPSGEAHAAAVFVNYGREEDYRALREAGVMVKGYVAVARRGELSRAAVVERAAEEGVTAVLMYTEGEGFRDGVERGTVLRGLGDPQTPGWGSGGGGGVERLGLGDSKVLRRFPKIPSMPISVGTAEIILRSLEGGRVPYGWRDTLRTEVDGVGPGPTLVNFTYQGEQKTATVQNIFAVIRGSEEPDRYVLLGNHRDAWTYGAIDPNSGTAALLDISRRYALLISSGWKPRRTVILCSWDAEEFGMIGSTEWVEKNLLNLRSKAVAYLNVDCAVQGEGFFAAASPQLDDLLIEVTKNVKDPDSEDMTVYEKWTAMNRGTKIQRLSGVDSDFAPFLQHAGVPSVDLFFGKDFRVYHTAFDSFPWMSTYQDPLFHRHVAVAGIWGLLGLRLADDPILQLNYFSYVHQFLEYIQYLENWLEENVSLHPVITAVQELASAAKDAESEAKKLREVETMDDLSVLKRRMLNDRLMLAERGFLDLDGFQGREWFKHLVFGPTDSHDRKLDFFPGIADAQSRSLRMNRSERQSLSQHEVWRVARAISRAAAALRGDVA